MLKNGVSHRCTCVKLSTKGGGIAPFWGSANLPEKVSRDMGYRSNSIAVSRDLGPLSLSAHSAFKRFCPELPRFPQFEALLPATSSPMARSRFVFERTYLKLPDNLSSISDSSSAQRCLKTKFGNGNTWRRASDSIQWIPSSFFCVACFDAICRSCS